MDNCVFKGCGKPQYKDGACLGHQEMAKAVMRGAPITCAHAVPLDMDCGKCALAASKRRLSDANLVQLAREGKLDDEMKAVDVHLRELHRTLLKRAFDSKLGPNGGEPIATHVGLPMIDGRVYTLRFEAGRYLVYWGAVEVIAASEADAVVLFFEGRRARGKGGTY